jgi:hypothetical protein
VSVFDALFRSLLADLATRPVEIRPFVGYWAASGVELAIERSALSLAVNSLTTGAMQVPPVAIDDAA